MKQEVSYLKRLLSALLAALLCLSLAACNRSEESQPEEPTPQQTQEEPEQTPAEPEEVPAEEPEAVSYTHLPLPLCIWFSAAPWRAGAGQGHPPALCLLGFCANEPAPGAPLEYGAGDDAPEDGTQAR